MSLQVIGGRMPPSMPTGINPLASGDVLIAGWSLDGCIDAPILLSRGSVSQSPSWWSGANHYCITLQTVARQGTYA